jgi:aminoglycoside 3'-phosphotransferase I
MRSVLRVPDAWQPLVAGRTWSRVTDGASGAAVYRLDASVGLAHFLKRAAEADHVTALRAEHDRLLWFAGRVRVPQVLGFVVDEHGATLLTDALPGRSAHRALEDAAALGASAVEALAGALGTWLRSLHAQPIDACPYEADFAFRLDQAIRRVAAGMVDEDDFDEERRGWRASDVVEALHALLPLPFERVLTHGDYSLDNVFVEGGQVTGVLDVGRAGVADPYQDIAICWRDLDEFGVSAQSAFLRGYGVHTMDAARCNAHLLLDELF